MPETLAIRMTAGYYVDAIMRAAASAEERQILRRLALAGLAVVRDAQGGHVQSVPAFDEEWII